VTGTVVQGRLAPARRRHCRTSIIEKARHAITQWRDHLSRLPDRRPYALQIMTHSGTFITIGPLTAAEAVRWEANLAASARYLPGLAIGGRVRQIRCGSEQHDIDPNAVPAHAESISMGLLSAWSAPGVDLIERLRIALCGQYGPQRARQLMASVPNSYEARQINGQRRPDQPR
jgi:hypothetical protein